MITFRGKALGDGHDFKAGEFVYGSLVFEGDEPYIVGPVVEANEDYIALEWWVPVDPATVEQCVPNCEKQTIKDSGDRTVFPTGAIHDMHRGKGRYDLIPWEAIHELALHCEAGALKYGERNVEKGIPISSLVDSAFRHLSKYMQGMDDEPHLRAALWNIAWAIWMEKKKPEMQDMAARLKLRDKREAR